MSGCVALATTLCLFRAITWTGRRAEHQVMEFIRSTLELISRKPLQLGAICCYHQTFPMKINMSKLVLHSGFLGFLQSLGDVGVGFYEWTFVLSKHGANQDKDFAPTEFKSFFHAFSFVLVKSHLCNFHQLLTEYLHSALEGGACGTSSLRTNESASSFSLLIFIEEWAWSIGGGRAAANMEV
ncbi:hypothetical protein XENOCAPTIV_020103 [Xenoophorus captivus]|uniref:Uncharacterized protein n=1 Tax=Xenoophorus captivus TaxID=1517983 RepID=A0ABV0SGK9_9TELE